MSFFFVSFIFDSLVTVLFLFSSSTLLFWSFFIDFLIYLGSNSLSLMLILFFVDLFGYLFSFLLLAKVKGIFSVFCSNYFLFSSRILSAHLTTLSTSSFMNEFLMSYMNSSSLKCSFICSNCLRRRSESDSWLVSSNYSSNCNFFKKPFIFLPKNYLYFFINFTDRPNITILTWIWQR